MHQLLTRIDSLRKRMSTQRSSYRMHWCRNRKILIVSMIESLMMRNKEKPMKTTSPSRMNVFHIWHTCSIHIRHIHTSSKFGLELLTEMNGSYKRRISRTKKRHAQKMQSACLWHCCTTVRRSMNIAVLQVVPRKEGHWRVLVYYSNFMGQTKSGKNSCPKSMIW